MIKRLTRLWEQVFKNWDSALVIAISVFVAFYGVFSDPLLSAISSTLGLLAIGTIKDRNAREDLLQQVQQLKAPPSVGSVFLDRGKYIPFNNLTASAQMICMVGPSLVSLFNQYSDYFRDIKLNGHGATIQAIILDPKSSAVKSAADCIGQSVEAIKDEIENTKRNVSTILMNKNGLKNGKLELRTFSTSLNFSMILVDPNMPNGKIIVEFIGYHAGLHNIPHIELTPSRDKEWYQFFLQQYNLIYRDSKTCLSN